MSCIEFGHGHINLTYKIITDTGAEYILQRINKYVIKDPVKVMANASTVTNFLLKKTGLYADFIVCSADYIEKRSIYPKRRSEALPRPA